MGKLRTSIRFTHERLILYGITLHFLRGNVNVSAYIILYQI